MPVPSKPAAQAAGAPICPTDGSSVAWTRPSRSTRTAPSARAVGAPVASRPVVSERQNPRAVRLSARKAAAPTRPRVTVLRAWSIVARFGPPPGRQPPPVVDDDRDRRPVGIVVAVRDEPGHVEQAPIEATRREQGHRRLGEDVEVVADAEDRGLGDGPGRPRLEDDGPAAVRVGRHPDHVTRDQGHRLDRRRHGPGRQGPAADAEGAGTRPDGRRGRRGGCRPEQPEDHDPEAEGPGGGERPAARRPVHAGAGGSAQARAGACRRGRDPNGRFLPGLAGRRARSRSGSRVPASVIVATVHDWRPDRRLPRPDAPP